LSASMRGKRTEKGKSFKASGEQPNHANMGEKNGEMERTQKNVASKSSKKEAQYEDKTERPDGRLWFVGLCVWGEEKSTKEREEGGP